MSADGSQTQDKAVSNLDRANLELDGQLVRNEIDRAR